MELEKLSLFDTKHEFFKFIFLCIFILCYTLLIEYNNYKNLTRFDSNIITATVLKQYSKTKTTKKGKTKTYQILKLKADSGFVFYTMQNKNLPHTKGLKIKLEIWAGKINFYEYMNSFFTFGKIIYIYKTPSPKQKLNSFISTCHKDKDIANIYQALYTATTLKKDLQNIFSSLGLSHLVAISGFHLGVLSMMLFFLFRYPYRFFQSRFFPYRNYKLDPFVVISSVLLLYMLFLDTPPSLLRAFVMLMIGFTLYERGFEIISMQTLFLTIIFILAFFPRLFFSIGFWLSISGVFYIFLFFIHFKHISKTMQFLIIPFWVYIFMLPFSIAIFGNFSIYHPLSIITTILFTLFYPLSIVFHTVGFCDLFDEAIKYLITLKVHDTKLDIGVQILTPYIFLSFVSVFKKSFLYLTLLFAVFLLIYAMKHITY